MNVEVAYAKPEKQVIISLEMPKITTVEQAIEQSGILSIFSEINLIQNKIGIFGNFCGLKTVLREGDRVEIYRPLGIDPKIGRRERALLAKV